MSLTLNDIQDQVIAEMAALEDGFAMFEYLIELGKNHPKGDPTLKTEEFLVPGCQSQVWIKTELNDGRVQINADSDALITKGIISLVLRVLNNQAPNDILAADLYFIADSGLGKDLSPSRANGLQSIINSIRSSVQTLTVP